MTDPIQDAIINILDAKDDESAMALMNKLRSMMAQEIALEPQRIATLVMVAIQFSIDIVTIIEKSMADGGQSAEKIDCTKAAIASMMMSGLTNGEYQYTPQEESQVFIVPIQRPTPGVVH